MFPICDEQGRVIGFSGRFCPATKRRPNTSTRPKRPSSPRAGSSSASTNPSAPSSTPGLPSFAKASSIDWRVSWPGCKTSSRRKEPPSPPTTRASSNVTWTRWCCVLIRTKPARMPPCGRSTICWRPAWPCGWRVPAPHDPDSFIKANGGDAFRQLVESAEGFFDYYLNRLCKLDDANSDRGRNAILRGMAEAVHKTGNNVLADKYAQKTALRLGVSPKPCRPKFSKLKVRGSGFKVRNRSRANQLRIPNPKCRVRPTRNSGC